MNLRDNMNQLFKTFANEHDENFHNTKATLIQLERETTLREEKLVMNECMTALIELQQQFRRTLQAENKIHQKISARNALGTLSYSEYRIILHILDELNNQDETIIVASQMADKIGITRSVAVNALKHLEDLGIHILADLSEERGENLAAHRGEARAVDRDRRLLEHRAFTLLHAFNGFRGEINDFERIAIRELAGLLKRLSRQPKHVNGLRGNALRKLLNCLFKILIHGLKLFLSYWI